MLFFIFFLDFVKSKDQPWTEFRCHLKVSNTWTYFVFFRKSIFNNNSTAILKDLIASLLVSYLNFVFKLNFCFLNFKFSSSKQTPFFNFIFSGIVLSTEQPEMKRSDITLAKRERDGKYYQKSISASVWFFLFCLFMFC